MHRGELDVRWPVASASSEPSKLDTKPIKVDQIYAEYSRFVSRVASPRAPLRSIDSRSLIKT